MGELKLGCGDIALVDDEDIERLGRVGWYGHHNPSGGVYVHRTVLVGGRKRNQALHRAILGAERGQVVDHINGNPLDNRRRNLRFATPSENRQNTHHSSTTKRGRYKGVHRHGHKFIASIHAGPLDKDGEMGRIYLGLFATQEEAAQVYDSAALYYFGEFAATNFPDAKARAPQTEADEAFGVAFMEGYRACQADAKGRARRIYMFEAKALALPEPAAPAPLPRKVEPGTELTPGARYRITEIASWDEDPGHRIGDELVCGHGPSAGIVLPGWGTHVGGGGCWRAHALRRDTYVTGLELVAEAPAALPEPTSESE